MKYTTKTIALKTPEQRNLAIAAINNAPLDLGLELIIREHKKQRSPDANSLMWAGPLKDIAEQVWVDGRTYSAEVWHEYFKRHYLVDEATEPYLHEHVKNPESYHKWDFSPDGIREIVGSTTQLTPYGFSQYLEQIHADGARRGVQFHSNPKDSQR